MAVTPAAGPTSTSDSSCLSLRAVRSTGIRTGPGNPGVTSGSLNHTDVSARPCRLGETDTFDTSKHLCPTAGGGIDQSVGISGMYTVIDAKIASTVGVFGWPLRVGTLLSVSQYSVVAMIPSTDGSTSMSVLTSCQASWIPSDDGTYFFGATELGSCFAVQMFPTGSPIEFYACDHCDTTCAPDNVAGPVMSIAPFFGDGDAATDPLTQTPFASQLASVSR